MTESLVLNEMTICYEDCGTRVGRPLLMLHGFTGHRDDFEGVREDLSEGRRVLIPDLRGHGDSGRATAVGDYNFESVIEDLCGLLDHLQIEDVDLLGHSMGGMIALRFALAYPQRVHSLIAMNTTPEATEGMRADGLRKASRLALEEGMGVLEEVSRRVSMRRPDPVIARWAERYWPHRRRRFLAAATSILGLAGVGTLAGSFVASMRHSARARAAVCRPGHLAASPRRSRRPIDLAARPLGARLL